jgi:hypothetical protein
VAAQMLLHTDIEHRALWQIVHCSIIMIAIA